MINAFDPAQIRTAYWVFLGVALAAMVAIAWMAQRMRGRWRGAMHLVLLVAGVRLLLVGNPVAWHIYAHELDGNFVGWRQADEIRHKGHEYFEPTPVRYLAVGSSQTGAIYKGLARSRDDLDTFIVAGMRPLDLQLHRDWIASRKPEWILLYLSEFDMARRPDSSALTIAPPQGIRLGHLWRQLRALPEHGAYDQVLTDFAIGELFPEYHYRYVFRGLVRKAMWHTAFRIGRVTDVGIVPASEDDRIRAARQSLAPEYVPFNVGVLREYLQFATQHSDVIILEGHYNPRVFTESTNVTAGRVRTALSALADTMDRVTYSPRSAIRDFSESDYYDLSHVNERAGAEFAGRVIDLLEQSRKQAPGTTPD